MGDIRRLIDARGIRHRWLADRLGISRSHLSHLLSGDRRFTDAQAVRLAELLQIPVDYIRQAQPGAPSRSEPMEAGV